MGINGFVSADHRVSYGGSEDCKPSGRRTSLVNKIRKRRSRLLNKRGRSEKLDICRRLRKLQRLIPGGMNLKEIDLLFKETAEYIMALRFQVEFLQVLSDVCDDSFTN
eukprot:TRINITY_DN455_c0_g1_i1.p1 TRINITY_DN455_c0_g1~~TRINITY_DN455_c0_g1_i1.p1  ORF type:complete len:108 (-),score=18.01 TRINITY_DN455_c0_g1_i1:358-681(-)